MNKKISKTDWWQISGCCWVVVGLFNIFVFFFGKSLRGWLGVGLVINIVFRFLNPLNIAQPSWRNFIFGGALGILLGVGFLVKNKAVLWITSVLMVLSMVYEMRVIDSFELLSLVVIAWVVPFILMVMMWQQIRHEKGKK